jgi:hypothetical protein
MFDEELLLGSLPDGARDCLTILRSEDQRPQDKEVECARQKFEALAVSLGRHFTRTRRLFWVRCQPEKRDGRRQFSVHRNQLGLLTKRGCFLPDTPFMNASSSARAPKNPDSFAIICS